MPFITKLPQKNCTKIENLHVVDLLLPFCIFLLFNTTMDAITIATIIPASNAPPSGPSIADSGDVC